MPKPGFYGNCSCRPDGQQPRTPLRVVALPETELSLNPFRPTSLPFQTPLLTQLHSERHETVARSFSIMKSVLCGYVSKIHRPLRSRRRGRGGGSSFSLKGFHQVIPFYVVIDRPKEKRQGPGPAFSKRSVLEIPTTDFIGQKRKRFASS